MEQLEHEIAGAVLHQRRDRRVAEIVVGLARQAREIVLRHGVADEWTDHFDGDFGIGPAGEAGDGLRIEPRPGFRHIEAAVTGKAREHDLQKAERRGFAAGGNVAHDPILSRPLARPGRDLCRAAPHHLSC